MRVTEVFNSIQGEGSNAGMSATFLRLQGCKLDCNYCDTRNAQDMSGGVKLSLEEVIEQLREDIQQVPANNLVITGGEPLLQKNELYEVLKSLQVVDWIECETSGRISPGKLLSYVDMWNVSPKLSNSGNPTKLQASFYSINKSIFKYVCSNKSDLKEVDEHVQEYDIPHTRVFILPMSKNFSNYRKRVKRLWDLIQERGYNLSPRLHLIANEK